MYTFKVVNHPTQDLKQPQILLQTAHGKKYLFGKNPEGLQRSFNEQKIGLNSLNTIFLSGELNWENLGGFPGMILTLSDRGNKNLDVYHGNPLLNYVISTWRYFVFRFGMNLNSKILNENNLLFEDDIMKVKAVNLIKSNDEIENESSSLMGKLTQIISKMFPLDVKANEPIPTENEDDLKKMYQSDPTLIEPYIHVKLPNPSPNNISTCYEIQLNSVRGKFNPIKAKELGIPKGPLFATLAKGLEITLPNGDIIQPTQVLAEQRLFKKILVIDIPSIDYIESAINYNWNEFGESKIGVIYHFLNEKIDLSEDSKYWKFINSFDDDVIHYISHPKYSPNSIIFKRSSLLILKLKSLQPNNYNLPESKDSKLKLKNFKNIKILLQGQSIQIESEIKSKLSESKIKYDNSNVQVQGLNPWEWLYNEKIIPLDSKISSKEQVLDLKSISKLTIDETKPLKDQVETITLGTGSALPSEYRNVTSNLVRIPFKDIDGSLKYRSILLDGGENTIGTLKRTLTEAQIPQYFKELKLIYLSHLHADHHLGIMSIVNEWFIHNKDSNDKLYLVTPWQYNHFVNEWIKVENNSIEDLNKIEYISCEDFLQSKSRQEIKQIEFDDYQSGNYENERLTTVRNFPKISQLYQDLGIKKFSTCRAYHCPWAYSVSINFQLNEQEFFKISYSGDTRPNFLMFAENIGKNSDLLIHEATLSNDLSEEAKKKKHCTINEAIEVSNAMEADNLILTHFSQRYPQLPEISNNVKINSNYCFAFDSMIVRLDEIKNQKLIFKDLEKIFKFAKEEELENENEIEDEEMNYK
ncbi:hypothetical protein WICMUC_004640 [Wickerhamomyces mucosus]|uniref:ribonuclease Z n=1 Tax=Wickerhamomyces mucosus TaxID=1378264 RepID=A0A9P8TA14_9ASCO|nr:hypothetical protein WICMUC_004640 [Wickerhamomyces mucosus]